MSTHTNGAEPVPETAIQTVTSLFRRTGPLLLATLASGLIVARILMAQWRWADLLACATVVALWPFVEWLIHVHLLHARPRRLFGRIIDPPVARRHREHHRDPADLAHITINIRVFYVAVPMLFALVYGLTPDAALATTILATIFTLTLHYEWCHFVAHVRWTPALGYYRRRQHAHRLHHYRDEQRWWGVSTGIGDWLLGTAPDARAVQRSPTVHDVNGLDTGKSA